MAASSFYFTQIGRPASKICLLWLSLLQYVPMVTIQKWGRRHFKFFLQSLHACDSISFRYWVFTNFPFRIIIFKALYNSVPEILTLHYGSRSKMLNCTSFQWSKTNCRSPWGMSEEQIMLKLEMCLVSFCQSNCIEQICLNATNIIFPKVVWL